MVRGQELTRNGLSSDFAMKVLHLGLESSNVSLVRSCAMVLFSFLFQCRSVTVNHIKERYFELSETGDVIAALVSGNPIRLLILCVFRTV